MNMMIDHSAKPVAKVSQMKYFRFHLVAFMLFGGLAVWSFATSRPAEITLLFLVIAFFDLIGMALNWKGNTG